MKDFIKGKTAHQLGLGALGLLGILGLECGLWALAGGKFTLNWQTGLFFLISLSLALAVAWLLLAWSRNRNELLAAAHLVESGLVQQKSLQRRLDGMIKLSQLLIDLAIRKRTGRAGPGDHCRYSRGSRLFLHAFR